MDISSTPMKFRTMTIAKVIAKPIPNVVSFGCAAIIFLTHFQFRLRLAEASIILVTLAINMDRNQRKV